MKNKNILISIILFLTSSCSGMGGKRSDKSDEFLIEKKNPLVMPPDINDLPEPNQNTSLSTTNSDFENSLKTINNNTQNSNSQVSSSLEESIIKKID